MTNDLIVLSYNIWFDKAMCFERTASLCEYIISNNADVVCLQEVRPEIFEILISLLKDFKYYFPKKINKDYGCVTFSKYQISKCLDFQYYNSSMGRSLLITKINYPHKNEYNVVNNIDIVIANSHFESLFKKYQENEVKLKQYEIARQFLDTLYVTYKNVILCSDTNVMQNEEYKFDQEFEQNLWIDCWKIKGTTLNEFTYDSKLNSHLNIKLMKFPLRSRIDRILYKTNNCYIDNFDIIKSNNTNNIEPSDHFGVYCKFLILND